MISVLVGVMHTCIYISESLILIHELNTCECVYFNMALHDESYCLQKLLDPPAEAAPAEGKFVFTALHA
jgi:hypothetical protein